MKETFNTNLEDEILEEKEQNAKLKVEDKSYDNMIKSAEDWHSDATTDSKESNPLL